MPRFSLLICVGLLPALFPTLVHGLEITVTNDLSSYVGSRHPLTLTIVSEAIWPKYSNFALLLDSRLIVCTYIESFTFDYFDNNCTIHRQYLNFTMKNEEVPVGTTVTLVLRNMKYNVEFWPLAVWVEIVGEVDGEMVIFDEGVNTDGWMPADYAKIRNFAMDTFGPVYTRRMFDFNLTGMTELYITSESEFTLEFNHDFDTYFPTYIDFAVTDVSPRNLSGIVNVLLMDNSPVLFRVANFRIPATTGTLTLRFTTYSIFSSNKIYLTDLEIPIEPEVVYYSKNVKLIKGQKICERGTYTVVVDPHSTPVFNPRYEITAPYNIFGDQLVTVLSTEQLDESHVVTFELTNPCSVVPLSVLDAELFEVAVYRGDEHDNEVAFVLRTGLGRESTYEPGKLQQLQIQLDCQGYASASSFTFSMNNDHSIPAGGKIKLSLNRLFSVQPDYRATVNSAFATSTYLDSSVSVVLPNAVPASAGIQIVLSALVNPAAPGDYSLFSAQSFDERGYLIDESEYASVTINQPAIVAFSSAMSSTRNLDYSVYTFTLTSPRLAVSPNDLLGLKVPPEISLATCSLVSHAPGTSPDSAYDHDFWLVVSAEGAGNVVEFSIECRNPSTTARTSSFEFVVVTPGGIELIKGETTVKTTEASLFLQSPLLLCEKTCSGCSTTCSLILNRETNTKFKSIIITNERLNFEKLECKYDSTLYTSTCTIPNGFENSIQLTVSDFVDANTITVTNINLLFPEHSEAGSTPLKVRTYATENAEDGALMEEGETAVDSGSCMYPCKSCSQNLHVCDECLHSLPTGQPLYLYPEGMESCGLETSTNCRVLVNEKCCSGYYKNELTRQCLKCDSECGECEGTKDNCTSCKDSSKFLYQSTCQTQCEEGTFVNPNSVRNECVVCPQGCKVCNSPFDCSLCQDDHVFHEVQKLCVQECPEGSFIDGDICRPCSADCAACEGTRDRCTKCSQEKANKYLTEDGKCVDKDTCEDGGRNFYDGASCKPCSASCKTCKGSVDFCATCEEGKFYKEAEGTCVNTCPPNSFVLGGKCVPCDSTCATCISAAECTSCVSNAHLLPATKQCVFACPEKHYEYGGVCYSCSEHCEKCGSGGVCAECEDGYFIVDGKCHQSCPPGTFNSVGSICEDCDPSCASCEKSKHMCTECAPGYYLHSRQCVAICPETMVVFESACQFCNSPCRECSGSLDFCTACHPSDYFYNNTCWNTCPQSTVAKLDLSHICVDCPEGGKECTWTDTDILVPTFAISCLPGYKYLNSKCYSSCPSNYIESSDGLTCVSHITASNKNRYYIFPHLIVTMILMVVATLVRTSSIRTLITPVLVVLLNYLAISSYLLCILSLSSEHTFAKIFLAVIISVQLILNIIFMILYNFFISSDEGFVAWGKNHCCMKYGMLLCSVIFTFQSFRLLYSCLTKSDLFFVRFKKFRNLFKPLNTLSILQILFVQGMIIVFGAIELVYLTYGTFSHSFMKEAFALSFLLFVALCFEVRSIRDTVKGLESETPSATANPRSTSNQTNSQGLAIESSGSSSKALGIDLKKNWLNEKSSLKEKEERRSDYIRSSAVAREILNLDSSGASIKSKKNLSSISPMLASRIGRLTGNSQSGRSIVVQLNRKEASTSSVGRDEEDKQGSVGQSASEAQVSFTSPAVANVPNQTRPHNPKPPTAEPPNLPPESKKEAKLENQEELKAVPESLPELEDAMSSSFADVLSSSVVSKVDAANSQSY